MLALDCGLGGLKWSEVQPLIEKHLGSISDLDVYVYESQSSAVIRSDVDGKNSDAQTGEGKISARPQEL